MHPAANKNNADRHPATIRVSNLLKKLDRIENIYRSEEDIPEVFHVHTEQQRQRLNDAKEKFGKDTISPFDFE